MIRVLVLGPAIFTSAEAENLHGSVLIPKLGAVFPHPASVTLTLKGHVLPLGGKVHIMGVLNVTPDSFSDGGRYFAPDLAVEHALAMVEQGADLLDIGAESSRPGADPVDVSEEIRRLIPVVQEVCRRVPVPISVDTQKASVARLALDAGAAIINDISALRSDPVMGQIIAASGAALVLMHMQGTPKDMQQAPRYECVIEDVRTFFEERMRAATDIGIQPDRILLDPGIGFGKHFEHNLTLLGRLNDFRTLGRPIMIGVSRKAFIGRVLGRGVGERLMGTAGAVAAAVLHGARVVRVHDVAEMRDVVKMVQAIQDHQGCAIHALPSAEY